MVGVTEYAGLTGYTGGIGRHYASLLPALARLGVEIDLVVFSDEPRPAASAMHGVRLIGWHRLHRMPAVALPLARAAVLRRAFLRERYDAVFAPEWAGVAALLPRRAPLVTNLATSTRVANRVAGFSLRSFGRRRFAVAAQSLLEDRQIRRSRGLIPISRAMLAANRRELGALPESIVVRNCIDVAAVQRAAAAADRPNGWLNGWPDGRTPGPTVLFLGRLERRKGVVAAMAALARILPEQPDLRFVLAGASGDARFEPSRAQLLAPVPLGSRDRVLFLGHVAGDELYRGIRDADVVICPSLWEGFGQVALEAKALGTAVVVTGGSGYDDFCADGVDALVVPPGDAEALADAVTRLLQDPTLRARLAATAATGADAYTADAVAPDLRTAVRRLLG